MRYDPEKFKAESATHYQKLLEGVKGPLTHEKALELHNEANKRTLDDIASSVDVDGLVEELTNPENTQYFHMGEGMFMFYKRNIISV